MRRGQQRIQLTFEVVVPADADPTDVADRFIAAWNAHLKDKPALRTFFFDATTPEAEVL